MGFEPPVKMLPWKPPYDHPATTEQITACIDAVVLAACHAEVTPEQAREIRYGYAQKMRLIMTPAIEGLMELQALAMKALADPNEKNKGSILKSATRLAKEISGAIKP